MFLSFVLAILAAVGLLSIVRWLCQALAFSLEDHDICHVIRLQGEASQTEQAIKSGLRLRKEQTLKGKLVFVDEGLSPDAQNAAELLLRKQENAILCSKSQLCELLNWEKEDIGTGTDQRQHRRSGL